MHDSISEPTPRLHSDSEGEENVDIEMQSNQSKHVSRKRSWLVDVIGKIVNLLIFMCNCPSHIVFVFYVYLKPTIYFICILTDDEGTQVRKQLTLNDVWFLSSNERILVKWNSDNQPIDDSGALLNRFLGRVARNVNAFPISYQSWRKIPNDYKEDILKKTIQVIDL